MKPAVKVATSTIGPGVFDNDKMVKSNYIPWHQRIYALYKGDNFLSVGTINEISEETNKTVDSLRWMTHPAYTKRCGDSKKRLRLFQIEE